MSTVNSSLLQSLLEYNRALYHGHVFGQCTHPLEVIHRVSQDHERLAYLAQLCHDALLNLQWIRYYYINGQVFQAYATGEILWNQVDLVSDEILDVLAESLPGATVSLQRDLCEQYKSIMKMSLADVSVYLSNIQHGEDFVVCLRKLAVETLFHPRWASILRKLDVVETTHQEFLDSKSDMHTSLKDKILLQRRVQNAKADVLDDIGKMCVV